MRQAPSQKVRNIEKVLSLHGVSEFGDISSNPAVMLPRDRISALQLDRSPRTRKKHYVRGIRLVL